MGLKWCSKSSIALIHELVHQKYVKDDQSETRKRKDTPDSQYDNKEEKKVIEDIGHLL